MTTKKLLGIGALIVIIGGASFVGTAGANMAADPMGQIGMFRNLIGLIHDMARVAEDPTAAGVAAVYGIEDHLGKGERSIAFLEDVLADTKNPAIKRAVRLKLSDLYKHTGNTEKAVEQLRLLIVSDPEP